MCTLDNKTKMVTIVSNNAKDICISLENIPPCLLGTSKHMWTQFQVWPNGKKCLIGMHILCNIPNMRSWNLMYILTSFLVGIKGLENSLQKQSSFYTKTLAKKLFWTLIFEQPYLSMKTIEFAKDHRTKTLWFLGSKDETHLAL